MIYKQKAFTLVEMAIVLVIIGLLLGGVLKGQELIENSRIKSAINDLKGMSTANTGYFDRFRAYPGDDGPAINLSARSGSWTDMVSEGNKNGLLDITAADTFSGTGEGLAFFRHLRAAGFLSGSLTAVGTSALPVNPFGGLIGVTGANVMGFPANSKLVCMGSVPGKSGRSIDLSIDDGHPASGLVRSTLGDANSPPGVASINNNSAYSDTQTYTLCTPM
jgi:prepilin-type N-terminal cleavage/methylation domain-containing protein